MEGLLSNPWALIGLAAWLGGLSCGMLFLWGRVQTLQEEQHEMSANLGTIARDLSALRHDLAGLARAQQVDDMRRILLSELRPMLADAIALQQASRPRRAGKQVGIEFEGNATISGAVAGGGIGQISGGTDGGSS